MTSLRSAPDPGEARTNSPVAPGLGVAAVARRLGVAPATLRTWDRRYELGPSEHRAGSHRRYTTDDVARLLIMRRLTLEGVAPVDAAKAALAADDEQLAAEPDPARRPASGGQVPAVASKPPEPDGENLSQVRESRPVLRAISGGDWSEGQPSPSSSVSSVSDVVDAAIAYDQRTCDRLLRLDANADPAQWWNDLVEPALARLAERTVLAGPGEAPEIVLANATLSALRAYSQDGEDALVQAGGPPRNHPSRMRRIVLVFTAPHEPLPLSAHVLAAALGAHGAMARVVTGPTNSHRTLELVTMVRPAAVAMLTVQARPDLGLVHAVHEAYPALPLFVGMPRDEAAGELPLAATVQRVRSFPGLLHELLATVR